MRCSTHTGFRKCSAATSFSPPSAPGNYLFPVRARALRFRVGVRRSRIAGARPTWPCCASSAPSPTPSARRCCTAWSCAFGEIGWRRACAVAIYHLIPLDFGVLAVGNLTNAFAQALSVAALVMMASVPLQLVRLAPTLLLTGILTAAFLSHTEHIRDSFRGMPCDSRSLLDVRRSGPAAIGPRAGALRRHRVRSGRRARTTRTSWRRTARSCRGSRRKQRLERLTPPDVGLSRGCCRCRVTCMCTSASRR